MPQNPSPYRGRFAPSPSGPLHFGSLIAATASYLQARCQQGEWHLRIEDVDEPRTVPGAADNIISSLDRFGFQWQGEIIYQSRRKEAYMAALQQLIDKDLVFPCQCSRQEIRRTGRPGPFGYIYPGHCRHRSMNDNNGSALRILSQDRRICFEDEIQGLQQQNIQLQLGDFVIRRRDHLFAYQLAVVVDDEALGINHIIRGTDLLDSTARQIYLQQLLAYHSPEYAHLPLAISPQGDKLSKKSGAQAINTDKPVTELFAALNFLGQQLDEKLQHADLNTLWEWAIEHWSIKKIPQLKSQTVTNITPYTA